MTIRESLKRFRKEFNLTRNEVAEVLGIKPQSYIYEVKDVTPSAQVILELADHYNISADYLLGLTDEPRPLKVEVQDTPIETETTDDIKIIKERLAKLENTVAKLAR